MDAVRRFLAELRRRKVYRVAVVYAAVAFVVWQVAVIAFPSLGLPESAIGAVLVFTVLGFPVALVLAWAYEVRPEEPVGVSTDRGPTPEAAAPAVSGTPGASAVASAVSATGSTSPSGLSTTPSGVSQEPPVASAMPAALSTPANSVAILPFESMSPGEEGEYFADGIAEEITNVLAGLADLHVAARTSAFAFKGQQSDIREIGQKLNVAYLVEGSVRRAGDALRITAQLIDTSTGYHVWSERFDRATGDVFEIQDEIASAVAVRLTEHVGRTVGSPRPVARSSDLPAYELYLQGRQLMAGFADTDMVEAASRFEGCIALDPDFAAAHAGLAEALTLQSIGFQITPEKRSMPRARQEAERALELHDSLPEAHLARALVAMFYEWDHKTAKAEFDRAETLGPNVARVHMWKEFYFTYVEHDYESALAENKRAQELNPMDPAPPVREATVRYLFGDFADAEALFRDMLAEQPDQSMLHAGLADTLVREGRIDEAVTSMERAVEYGGPFVVFLGIMGGFYALQGSVEKARDALRQLEDRSSRGYISSFWMAVVQSGLGDLDAAFASLEQARENRESSLIYVFFVPRALGLHEDPRFAGVLRGVGLSHLVALL